MKLAVLEKHAKMLQSAGLFGITKTRFNQVAPLIKYESGTASEEIGSAEYISYLKATSKQNLFANDMVESGLLSESHKGAFKAMMNTVTPRVYAGTGPIMVTGAAKIISLVLMRLLYLDDFKMIFQENTPQRKTFMVVSQSMWELSKRMGNKEISAKAYSYAVNSKKAPGRTLSRDSNVTNTSFKERVPEYYKTTEFYRDCMVVTNFVINHNPILLNMYKRVSDPTPTRLKLVTNLNYDNGLSVYGTRVLIPLAP